MTAAHIQSGLQRREDDLNEQNQNHDDTDGHTDIIIQTGAQKLYEYKHDR